MTTLRDKRQVITLGRLSALYKVLIVLLVVLPALLVYQMVTNRIKQPKTYKQYQMQAYSEVLLKKPKDPTARSKIAVMYLKDRQYRQAISQLQGVIKDNPKYIPANYYLGVAYQKQGENRLAEKQLLKTLSIIKSDKGKTLAAYRLAEIYKEQGKNEKALKYYSMTAASEPMLWNPHFELGHLYRQKGDLRLALDHYRQAVRFNPSPKINKLIKELERKTKSND